MAIDRLRRPASIPALLIAVLIWLASAPPSAAITLLRDAGIENALTRISAPLLRAAGLNPRRVRVLLVDDNSLNAFVLDNSAIYIHSGLILKVKTVAELQAVIAHEAAHIANGHIGRRMENLRNAQGLAGLGLALAVIAAAAGAGDAAGGIAIGTQSSALRGFLVHTRAEEAAADRSAMAYMRKARVDPRGMVGLHEIFRGQELLNIAQQDPYMRSHPLTADRIRAAKAFVAAWKGSAAPDSRADYLFARMRGKLSAFERSTKWTMRRLGDEKYRDVKLMREAVARHRQRNLSGALAAIDGALALEPGDPYYLDLKGQILMENRKWDAALAAWRAARAQAPNDPLILAGLGRALLAAGHPKAAIAEMEKARSRDWRNPRLLRDMANAYARTGKPGMAAAVTAERYAVMGRLDDAGLHARRAVAMLPAGSPAWQRAQDVLIAAERFEKEKKKKGWR